MKNKAVLTGAGVLALALAALALYFGLFPEGRAQTLLEALVKRVAAKDTHLDTGFVGTPFLCQVLSKYGANETAYALLLQDAYPGWLVV